ncbi:transport protein (probable substrate cationic amino acids) [Natrialba magadii ATCC 43099]|uniref:Amino acid permease-associated protein n=1 Tax=Natrialba magadii (strain ATCC 43099 / DSM 3394 / CCM 3739 / CIP 104546 / IAM 13178 / JCM 8861 / NBRC 102185 / NCIMB 2190 / MS3) TaxID=547559 RepID=D3SYI2_NATMM|nr:APC family permease [Natrialba magadii]ADD04093.1 transport protein (probable substrate cationic amino acids) [Natrialba magadii ATCC 43099]ELY33250.1 amino acid permease-associated protein [Natrialba magadii ATCC 43099]
MTKHRLINTEVGVLGATVLIIGNVIGVSAFVLPGPLAGDVGPGVIFALFLAMIPLLFGILMSLQLGSAIPAAGGSYVYASRLVGPFWGFLLPWITIPGVWAGMLFIGFGFAEYAEFVSGTVGAVPEIPELALVYGLLIPFIILNVLGIKMVAIIQFTMVSLIVVGMLAFIIPGAFVVDTANYTPAFPEGAGTVIVAIVSLYFPLRGFRLVLELGEEMEDPAKNIPRVLGLSAVISLTLLVGLVVVLVGTTNWQALGEMDAAVAQVSLDNFPAPLTGLVFVAAAMGALTSINMTYTAYSRLLMRAGRDNIIPGELARIHDRFESPHVAVLVLGIPPLLIAPVSPGTVTLSVALSLTILFGLAVAGVALWNLPSAFPQRYEYSLYKLPLWVLRFVAAGAVISAGFLWILVSTQLPAMVAVLAGWMVLGYGFYRTRLWWFSKRGVDLKARMRRLHENEQRTAD